jgi:hypothetical protein
MGVNMIDMDKAMEEVKTELMPSESWGRLPRESGAAYSAFCAFKDLGMERNIHKQYRPKSLTSVSRKGEE